MDVIRCPVSAGLNFRGPKLSDGWLSNRENRESLVPRKLRSIRYADWCDSMSHDDVVRRFMTSIDIHMKLFRSEFTYRAL